MDALTPLLVFRNMTHLIICDRFPIDLDDADIEQIATSLPSLRSFDVCSAPHESDLRPRVTLASLVSLATHCPRLSKLGLAISVAAVDFTSLPPEGAITPNKAITMIRVHPGSMVEHVELADIAKFMSRLFPRLVRFVYGLQVGDGYFKVWDRVLPYLLAYRVD
jgi:hypothetical protein